MKYTYEELKDLPTLFEGHSSNLKIETSTLRVWLCRVEKRKIYVERLIDGKWDTIESYWG